MLALSPYKIAVYLVRNDDNAVLKADVAGAAQLFLSPYAADRVVRAAQYIHLYIVFNYLFLKIVKVYSIMTVFVKNERRVYKPAAVLLYYIAEGVVNRAVYDDRVVWFCKRADRDRQSAYDARSLHYPAALRLKIEIIAEPSRDSLVI